MRSMFFLQAAEPAGQRGEVVMRIEEFLAVGVVKRGQYLASGDRADRACQDVLDCTGEFLNG